MYLVSGLKLNTLQDVNDNTKRTSWDDPRDISEVNDSSETSLLPGEWELT
jgi:hypothetical protein